MFHGRRWTIIYASLLSLVCASILALLHGALLSRIDLNRENARRRVILSCFGMTLPADVSGPEIKRVYSERIAERDVTLPDGATVSYFALNENGRLDAIAVPVEGAGLWSRIHGYVAIEAADFQTIRQVNFDQQSETPGLGGEIVADWFRDQFIGKSITHEGQPLGQIVAKPGTAASHQVDGISGATVTSVAVNDMLGRGFAHAVHIAQAIQREDSST